MGRRGKTLKMWKRKSNDTWYVTLNGEQIPLGKNERMASVEFHRLMAAEGVGPDKKNLRITVRELTDFWLDDCRERLDPATVGNYELHAESFAEKYGGMRAAEVQIKHVKTWLSGRKIRARKNKGDPISKSTKHLAITVVKLMMEWGEYVGHLSKNPIRQLKRPGIDRRRGVTDDEIKAVLGSMTPHLIRAVEFMSATGIRPGELCSVTAETSHFAIGKTIVKGKRTKRNPTGVRAVYLSALAVELLVPLIEQRPSGALFFSQGGRCNHTPSGTPCRGHDAGHARISGWKKDRSITSSPTACADTSPPRRCGAGWTRTSSPRCSDRPTPRSSWSTTSLPMTRCFGTRPNARAGLRR